MGPEGRQVNLPAVRDQGALTDPRGILAFETQSEEMEPGRRAL